MWAWKLCITSKFSNYLRLGTIQDFVTFRKILLPGKSFSLSILNLLLHLLNKQHFLYLQMYCSGAKTIRIPVFIIIFSKHIAVGGELFFCKHFSISCKFVNCIPDKYKVLHILVSLNKWYSWNKYYCSNLEHIQK